MGPIAPFDHPLGSTPESSRLAILSATPNIEGSITYDMIWANGFTPFGSVNFTIRQSPGGMVLATGTKPTDGGGNAQFNRWTGDHNVDLAPGMQIVVTDGLTTKDVTLVPMSVTTVNTTTNVVTGTAPALSPVHVDVGAGTSWAGQDTAADGSGHWSADVSPFQITAQMQAIAKVSDADGDMTSAGGQPARIDGSLTQDNIFASGFASSANVTLTIRQSPGGMVLDSRTKQTDPSGNAQFNRWQDHVVDLAPGMQLTVSDGAATKELTLAALAVAFVDPATDDVTGTAPAGTQVQVNLNSGPGSWANGQATADILGHWTVDFSGTFDITYTTNATASVPDTDGDQTQASRGVAQIGVSLSGDGIQAWSFAANGNVTFTIRESPGGTVLDSGTRQTDDAGNAQYLRPQDHGVDLAPGMQVTVTDGTTTKGVTLADVAISSIDAATDVVSGTAPADAPVEVSIAMAWGVDPQEVTADVTGHWSVDFTGTFDVTFQTQVSASVHDADGDRTSTERSPAWIQAWLTGDNVNANGFAADATVTFTIYASAGGAVLASMDKPTDGQGNAMASRPEDHDVDLAPGMLVTVTDGTITKGLTLVGLTIGSIDVANDVVTGTAPADAEVGVGVNDQMGGQWMQVAADADGSWSADFSGLWDITYTTFAGAEVRDGDGDATAAGMQPATIDAWLTWDSISANNFAADATVTFTILDSPGGTVLASGTKQADNAGNAQFNRYQDHDIDLVPGMEIVATDGSVTKELTLAPISITSIDASADLVTGTAPPSSQVQVNVNDPPTGGWGMQVAADGSGNWTADFAGMYDVTYTTNAGASVRDADGDQTSAGKQPAQIFVGLNGDNISGRGFAGDASVDFTILESPGGAELASGSGTTDSQGNVELGRGNDFDVDLAPGMQVTVTDGTTTKQLTLVDLAIGVVDPASDTVSGTAPPGADVQVNVDDVNSGSNLETTADGSGHWSVDFTGSFDVRYSSSAGAQVFDEDGDATTYNKNPARIHGGVTGGGINAEGFAGNADVSFTIYESPGGGELATGSRASDADGNVWFEPWNDFRLDLAPGMHVVVTDGTVTKELTLLAVAITSVDPATDVVAGTAPAGVEINVGIGDNQNGTGEMTTADGSGRWSVDFSPFDVTYAMWANAQVSDDDGDTTEADHGPTTIVVSLTGDSISGNNFAANADVTFTIHESPGGTELATGSGTSDPQGNVQFERGNGAFDVDLLPGMEVTVSDGTTTKQLTLAEVGITFVDPSTDTISGTAAPGTEIGVDVGVDEDNAQQTTTADSSGDWSVDFSPFDITYTMWAHAQVSDDDGDTTQAESGPSFIDVSLTWDSIVGNNFAANADVTFTIESAVGALLDTGSGTSDSQGNVQFDRGNAFDVDLLPGMTVTVSDGATTKELTLAEVGITLVDPSTDTVSGTAAPGASLSVGVGNDQGDGAGDMTTADGSGRWSLDFSPFDITWGSNASASIGDDDGDTTRADKNAPQIWGNLTYDGISAQGFTSDVSIDVTIRQTPGGTLLAQASRTSDAAGNVDFYYGDAYDIDLLPGMEVTVSDGTTTKQLTLAELGIRHVDPSADTVSGTAAPGAEVQVGVGDDQNGTGQSTTTDGSGRWSIDFSPFDITYRMNASANTADADGDQTTFDKSVPRMDVELTADNISAQGFAGNSSVSFTIRQTPGGTTLASGSGTSDAGGSVGFQRGDAFTVDLVPGMQVTVTDGTLTKDLTLAAVAVTSVDPLTETVAGTAPPDALVHVNVGDMVNGTGQDVTADSDGNWSVDFSPFDITPTTTANAGTDDLDNDSTWVHLTSDTTPPVATIDSGPSGLTNDSTPTFTFSADEPSTFECKVDSGSWTACTSPFTTAVLADGVHTVWVRATDTANNVGTPVSRTFTVDTVAPDTSIDSGPTGPTNDSTPTFTFSPLADVTFECKVDAGSWVSCTSPFTTAVLADGAHTFYVRATDAVGNVDATPASRSFTVDTVAPQTTIDSGPSGLTNDSTPTFGFSANELSAFECRIDTGGWTGCTSPHTTATLADGAHSFQVRATDAANNLGAAVSRSFTVDTAAPQTTIDSGPSGATADSTPTFGFSSEPGASFECKVDSGGWTTCTSPYTTVVLSEGAHTFQVRATDAAGNVDATPASRAFTVDTVAPQTTIDSGPSGPTSDSTPTFTFSANESSAFECKVDSGSWAGCTSPHTTATLADGAHSFQVRATDAADNLGAAVSRSFTVDTVAPETAIDSGPTGLTADSTPTFGFSSEVGARFECRVDSAAFAACSSPHTTVVLGDGAHTFEVRAIDSAGNADATPASRSFTIDTGPPETTIVSGPSGLTNDTTPAFSFSANEPSTFECKVDVAGSWAACTSPYTAAALADGAHTFQVRATDGVGNVDPSPASRNFTVHTGVPATKIDSGPASLTNDSTPTFAFSADEAATFECRVDSGGWASCTSPYTTPALADGAHVFNVRATDLAGNVDATPAGQGFTVHTGAPVTTITSGSSALTNDATPTFAFAADEPATFECKIDSGGWAACTSPYTAVTLGEGAHTFQVRATDAAGNVDATPASSAFTVDTVAPQTTIDSGPTGATNDSTPTFAFSASEAGGSFECRLDGGAFAVCTSPFTTPELVAGAHSLEVRAVDAAGNADATPAARSFTVVSAKASLTVVSSTATVSRTRIAALKLRCGAQLACRGTLSLSATVKGSLVHSRHRTVVVKLGSATFSITAGSTATVKVKLPLNGYKLLVRVNRLPATAQVRYAQPDGSTTTAVRKVTLRAAAHR